MDAGRADRLAAVWQSQLLGRTAGTEPVRQQTADSRQQAADSRQQAAGSRQQTRHYLENINHSIVNGRSGRIDPVQPYCTQSTVLATDCAMHSSQSQHRLGD